MTKVEFLVMRVKSVPPMDFPTLVNGNSTLKNLGQKHLGFDFDLK